MRGLVKAVAAALLLAPVLASDDLADPGKRDVIRNPEAYITLKSPEARLSHSETPELTTTHDAEPDVSGKDEAPGLNGLYEDDGPTGFDLELSRYQDLLVREAKIQEMILYQEQRLSEEYGWSPHGCGTTDCRGLLCMVESVYQKVSDAAAAIYEEVVGVEDIFEGPPAHLHGKGHWWKHPNHPKKGKPCKKPHKPPCPGRFPHHGNHTHGNHTDPQRPPHHRFPHHPPPFCRCPPPPHHPHRGPPHHGAPDDGMPPHHDENFHNDEEADDWLATRPDTDDESAAVLTPPGRKPPSHPKDHGIRPPPPGHDHGPHGHHVPLLLKFAAAASLLFVAFALHRRCYKSCVARREARRRRRAARLESVKRLFFRPWFKRGGDASQQEKKGMLRRYEEETSIEDELAGCRVAVDMVADMVAAEEGRARSQALQPRVIPGHITLASVPVFKRDIAHEEVLPGYDEASESSDGRIGDPVMATVGTA